MCVFVLLLGVDIVGREKAYIILINDNAAMLKHISMGNEVTIQLSQLWLHTTLYYKIQEKKLDWEIALPVFALHT